MLITSFGPFGQYNGSSTHSLRKFELKICFQSYCKTQHVQPEVNANPVTSYILNELCKIGSLYDSTFPSPHASGVWERVLGRLVYIVEPIS